MRKVTLCTTHPFHGIEQQRQKCSKLWGIKFKWPSFPFKLEKTRPRSEGLCKVGGAGKKTQKTCIIESEKKNQGHLPFSHSLYKFILSLLNRLKKTISLKRERKRRGNVTTQSHAKPSPLLPSADQHPHSPDVFVSPVFVFL